MQWLRMNGHTAYGYIIHNNDDNILFVMHNTCVDSNPHGSQQEYTENRKFEVTASTLEQQIREQRAGIPPKDLHS